MSLLKLKPPILKALKVMLDLHTQLGKTLTVTSTNDGKHMKGSFHYKDLAFDMRIWYLSVSERKEMVAQASKILGKDYDIILEKTHIHVEYDKK